MVRSALVGLMAAAFLPVPVGAWSELGGSATGGGISSTPGMSGTYDLSVDAGASGNPVVAWSEMEGAVLSRVHLRAWNGSTWAELGGSATGMGLSSDPDAGISGSEPFVRVDPQGRPVVAWLQGPGPGMGKVYLKRWTGATWQELGGSGSGAGIGGAGVVGAISQPALEFNAAGEPIVAWCEYDAVTQGSLYLREWDGAAWQELGGSATGSGVAPGATLVSMDCDSAGRPVVAWLETTGFLSGSIKVKRWDGAAWQPFAASADPGGISADDANNWPTVVVDNQDRPVVGFQRGVQSDNIGLYVFRWENSSSWVQLGGDPLPTGTTTSTGGGTSGGGGPSGGGPTPGGGPGGAAPAPPLGGSPSGTPPPPLNGGINTPGEEARMPRLAKTAMGEPMIAWTRGTDEVLAKLWDGAAWIEVAGSATGGGVSATISYSSSHSFSIGKSGMPIVAWLDGTSGNDEIYVKRFESAAPAGLDQRLADDSAPIAIGGSAVDGNLRIASTTLETIEVEIRPVGTSFSGVATHASPSAPFSVSGLAPESYHWQARTIDGFGFASAWTPFGGNAESAADFVVPGATSGGGSPPGGGPPGGVTPGSSSGSATNNGTRHHHFCGGSAGGMQSGWWLIAAAALAAALARRR